MPVYLVGFDVRNDGGVQDYAGLQAAMAKLEKHRLMPWLYLVSVPFTAGALKDYLLNQMGAKDCVWISKIHPRAKLEFAYQTKGGTSAWLKKHSRIELPVPPPARRAGAQTTVFKRANAIPANANALEAAL